MIILEKMVNHTFDSNYDANDTVADHFFVQYESPEEKSPFCSYTIVTRSNFEKPNRKTLRSHCSPADRLKSRIKSIHTIVVSDVPEK